MNFFIKTLAVLMVAQLWIGCDSSPNEVVVSKEQVFFEEVVQKKPNLLIVTMDTTRADRLKCYGYDRIETPNIDALAKEGALFEEAFSVQPVTLPAHCSIMTGKYPFRHGVRDNNLYKLSDKNQTLAEILTANGYLTTAFLASYILHREFGLSQGFTYYNDRFVKPKKKGRLPVDRRASEVSFLASEWLDKVEDTIENHPFFLWLHYYDPHADYDPPHPYKTAYPNPYDGEIAYMDDWLGFIFDELKERGLWDNTIVVLMADHGESLGEYGEGTHGMFIYRPTTRVPMIIKHKGVIPPGTRISKMVSSVDVMPTVLDILGFAGTDEIDGKSLMPLVRGEGKSFTEFTYSEVFIPRTFNWSELKGIRKADRFFIDAPKPEFLKLVKGENENAKENLLETEKEGAATYRHELHTMLLSTETVEADDVAVDDDMVKRLEALGYFVGGGAGIDEETSGEGMPDPKDRILFFNLQQRAVALSEKGRVEDAAVLLKGLVEQDKENTRFLSELGDMLTQLEKYKEAAKHLNKAIEVEPTNASHHYLLGVCYENWGKSKQALASFGETIKIKPDHFLAHFHSGLLFLHSKSFLEAEAAYIEASRIKPKDPTSLNNLGYAIIKGRGDYEAGIREIEKALEKTPNNPLVLNSLGSAYLGAKNYEKAKHYAEKALSMIPDHIDFIELLEEIYAKTGEREKLDALRERKRLIGKI